MTNPFQTEGTWLRCALHAHTTRSDGELQPEALVDHYERAEWGALAVTDHWTITEPPARDGMVLVPGIELTCRTPSGVWVDVLVYGLDRELDVDPDDERTYPDLPDAMTFVAEHGGVAYIAHPYWTGVPMDLVVGLPAVVGIEVYNAGCQIENGRGLSTVHWDLLLDAGHPCFAVACDDTHYAGFDSGYAWTMAHAAEATPEGVVAALREGACYASTGPRFDAVEPVPRRPARALQPLPFGDAAHGAGGRWPGDGRPAGLPPPREDRRPRPVRPDHRRRVRAAPAPPPPASSWRTATAGRPGRTRCLSRSASRR